MKVLNFKDYMSDQSTEKQSFTMFEKVLEDLAKRFDQSMDSINYAFQIAGNFDTLLMFCMAAEDLKEDVAMVADMSRKVAIPQTYLSEVRPYKENREDEFSASIVDFKKGGKHKE